MTFIRIYLLIGCLVLLVDYFLAARTVNGKFSEHYDELESDEETIIYRKICIILFIIYYTIALILWPLAVVVCIIRTIIVLRNKVNKSHDESIKDKES